MLSAAQCGYLPFSSMASFWWAVISPELLAKLVRIWRDYCPMAALIPVSRTRQ